MKDHDNFADDEVARRRDAALLRALSTPHKRQADMKIGKRQKVTNQEQSASGASHLADAPASQGASKS
jgi:hypothetical protein